MVWLLYTWKLKELFCSSSPLSWRRRWASRAEAHRRSNGPRSSHSATQNHTAGTWPRPRTGCGHCGCYWSCSGQLSPSPATSTSLKLTMLGPAPSPWDTGHKLHQYLLPEAPGSQVSVVLQRQDVPLIHGELWHLHLSETSNHIKGLCILG